MQKTWTWSTTGYGFAGMSHEEIIALCHAAGLSGIEGAPPLFEGRTDKELESIGAQYHDAGIQIQTFHLPFSAGDDMASFYETVRRASVETARKWIGRSALLGSSIGIQHPSVSRCSVDAEGLDMFIRQLDKSITELLPALEQHNYTLALENMLPGDDGGRLGSSPDHFERFNHAFEHDHVGFCLDTGHALVAAGPDGADDFHAVMAPRMAAYHLADNAGDRDSHLAPGHGRVDWDTVFRRAAEIEYAGCMCIETPPFAHKTGRLYPVEAWRQMVEDTDALVDQALK